MIAAIYARKSTEQSKISEDARSGARQVELARAFATLAVDTQHTTGRRDGF